MARRRPQLRERGYRTLSGRVYVSPRAKGGPGESRRSEQGCLLSDEVEERMWEKGYSWTTPAIVR